MSVEVGNTSRPQGNLVRSWMTDSRKLQLCRIQQSSNLLYLICSVLENLDVYSPNSSGVKREITKSTHRCRREEERAFLWLLGVCLYSTLISASSSLQSRNLMGQMQCLVEKTESKRDKRKLAQSRLQRSKDSSLEPSVGGTSLMQAA